MSDLKACPFCGGPGVVTCKRYVSCNKAGCPCDNVVVLPEAWNRRVPDERAEKVIEAARALYNAKAPASDSKSQLPGQPWRRLQDALREWETR